MKVLKYTGQILEDVLITYKIDGVRLHVTNGVYKSRANKELYNLPEGIPDGVYEIFRSNFKETISVVRSSKAERKPIDITEVYNITNREELDLRLKAAHYDWLSNEVSNHYMEHATAHGYEGLVLWTADKIYKVKKEYTEDLIVRGIIPGKGKHAGKMGALVTDACNVGTGFKDEERVALNTEDIIGKVIEVKFMEKTEGNKLRHPRFVKLRPDLKGE